MKDPEGPPSELTPKARRHKHLLIAVTVVLILLPLALATMRLLGIF
jgi:hypothetical protein